MKRRRACGRSRRPREQKHEYGCEQDPRRVDGAAADRASLLGRTHAAGAQALEHRRRGGGSGPRLRGVFRTGLDGTHRLAKELARAAPERGPAAGAGTRGGRTGAPGARAGRAHEPGQHRRIAESARPGAAIAVADGRVRARAVERRALCQRHAVAGRLAPRRPRGGAGREDHGAGQGRAGRCQPDPAPEPGRGTMRRLLGWLLAISVSVCVTLLVFFPAGWVAGIVEKQTGGRLTLGDAQGTLWRGSAFIGGAASANGAVTPLLPGRFSWRISPSVLWGSVDVELQNAQALSQAVNLRGSWSHWQVSPAALLLPADGLGGLGAPLNTVAPTGSMRLSWSTLELALVQRQFSAVGRTTLQMTDMASRLSSLRPLGSYELDFDWQGQQASLTLRSIKGPLLLDGSGSLNQGHMQFSGQAQAAAGYEETLASLLNLLGQRRSNSEKNIIALEFRQ